MPLALLPRFPVFIAVVVYSNSTPIFRYYLRRRIPSWRENISSVL